jgi:hypothetical protein
MLMKILLTLYWVPIALQANLLPSFISLPEDFLKQGRIGFIDDVKLKVDPPIGNPWSTSGQVPSSKYLSATASEGSKEVHSILS